MRCGGVCRIKQVHVWWVCRIKQVKLRENANRQVFGLAHKDEEKVPLNGSTVIVQALWLIIITAFQPLEGC
jgi:hypothetical protein